MEDEFPFGDAPIFRCYVSTVLPSSPRSSLVVQDPLDPFSVDGCGTFGLLLSVLIMDSGPGAGPGDGWLPVIPWLSKFLRNTPQGTNIYPKKWHFGDDFPFPKVGHVNSLEGTFSLDRQITMLNIIDDVERLHRKILTIYNARVV